MKQIRSFTGNRTDFIKMAGVGLGVAVLNPAGALRAQELVHPKGFSISTNQVLNVGDYLASLNGKFWAIMQDDGNFCLYEGSSTNARRYLWGSIQAASPWKNGYVSDRNHRYFAVMQSDGNFCVYQGTPQRKLYRWGSIQAAGYQSIQGNYAASLNDDGNFCVYKLMPPGVASSLLFSTNTASASRT